MIRALEIAVALAASALLVLVIPTRALVSLLIAATFVTRFRIHVFGHHFLIEHGVVVLTVTSMLLNGWGRRLLSAATRPVSVLLLAYIIWGVAASLAFAPTPAASLSIAVWLLFSWIILVVMLAWFERARVLESIATRWAAWAAVAAVVLWVLSRVGGLSYGTAIVSSLPSTVGGFSSGGVAAYGLSFEPNLLGSTMALWIFLALTSSERLSGNRSRQVAVSAGTVALLLSVSRAPLFGLLLGLFVWAALARGWASRRIVGVFGLAIVAVAVLAVAAPQTITPLIQKLDNSTNFQSGSGGARYAKAQQAADDLSGNWIGGLGLDSFSQRHLELTQVDQAAYLPTLPLQIVYDTGVIGAFLIVCALGAVKPLERRSRERRARGLGLVVIYGVSSLATSPFWFGSSWILIALAVLSTPRIESEVTEGPPVERGAAVREGEAVRA